MTDTTDTPSTNDKINVQLQRSGPHIQLSVGTEVAEMTLVQALQLASALNAAAADILNPIERLAREAQEKRQREAH